MSDDTESTAFEESRTGVTLHTGRQSPRSQGHYGPQRHPHIMRSVGPRGAIGAPQRTNRSAAAGELADMAIFQTGKQGVVGSIPIGSTRSDLLSRRGRRVRLIRHRTADYWALISSASPKRAKVWSMSPGMTSTLLVAGRCSRTRMNASYIWPTGSACSERSTSAAASVMSPSARGCSTFSERSDRT